MRGRCGPANSHGHRRRAVFSAFSLAPVRLAVPHIGVKDHGTGFEIVKTHEADASLT